MKTKDFNDGICENCSEVGLAGEPCRICGAPLVKIESGNDPILSQDDDFGKTKNEPEVYPIEELEKEEKIDDQIF